MNDLDNIPAAACGNCGGWTSFGGMSQHADATEPVLGRTGCTCRNENANVSYAARDLFDQIATEVYYGFNLRMVLSEATIAERGAIRKILVRAEAARTAAPKAARTQ